MTQTPFDSKSIEKAISLAIKDYDVPVNHKGAFALVATKEGVKGVIAIKMNDVWTVDSIVDVNYEGQLSAGVILKGSWK